MRAILLLAVPLGVACAGDAGALGQVDVGTECGATDFACVTAGLDGPVAVGGVVPLALDVDASGIGSPAISLIAADPGVLKVSGTEVRGEGEGVSALLLLAEGQVIDFLHVFVAVPDRIGLHHRDGGLDLGEIVDVVELLPGDAIVLAVQPYLGSQRLRGADDSVWSGDEEVVALLRDGVAGQRRLVARAPGEVELRVEAFGSETTLTVRVLP
jgi:hypothetical protein